MEEKFREICEEQDLYNNLRLDIKFTRVFIRYSVRILGKSYSISLFKKILSFFSFNKNFSYHIHLIKINLFRLEYFLKLSSENYLESLNIKKKWANYIITQSPSKKSIANAENYKKIISSNSIAHIEVNGNNLKKFYIYGPSSKNDPSEKYNDYTLVHLKPFPKKINFNEEILFLNSFYFSNAVKGNKNSQKSLEKRYKAVYVSCMSSEIPSNFIRLPLSNEGFISSEMALQRVLKFLIEKYETIECVIEGFDFYLSEDAYQNKSYDKLTRRESGIDEKEICLSLAEHDFYFNFMITRQFMQNIKLTDSNDFKKIINMSPKEYCNALFNTREFKLLK